MKMPRLYLGSMTFGWSQQTSTPVDESVAAAMLDKFCLAQDTINNNNNINNNNQDDDTTPIPIRLDTARIYADGKTEDICGRILKKKASSSSRNHNIILLGTKAHPSRPGGLSAAGIRGQWQESLQALQVQEVHEYYLHQPDPQHALEESLRTVHDDLIQPGKVQVLGMSNYHASEMQRAFDLCRQYDWTAPTVYQGLYNPLNRAVEQDLIPLLRANNCSFVAYNPLAGGMLTGKHTSMRMMDGTITVAKGRFANNNRNYLPRFYTAANFSAVAVIQEACNKAGITMVQATLTWLLRHSALAAHDGILLGASSTTQLDENLQACAVAAVQQQPLPENVLQALDEAWEITRTAGVFPYWRSYSADMPHRESLDPGALYEANKK